MSSLVESYRAFHDKNYWPFSMIDHLSPSAFDTLTCPEKFRQQYVLKQKRRPAEALLVGSAVHSGVEVYFGEKVEGRYIEPADVVRWYDDDGWRTILNREQEAAGMEVEWETDPDQAKQRGRVMLAHYLGAVGERLRVIGVEGRIETDIFGLPVPVVGRFDIETEDTLIDLKTGKQTRKKPKGPWRVQALIYGEAVRKPVEFHSLSASLKTGVPNLCTPLESPDLLIYPAPEQIPELRRLIRDLTARAIFYYDRYGPDEPWPTEGYLSDWLCDYCSFQPSCPIWSHR